VTFLQSTASHADNHEMAWWSVRDLWGRLTEKKGMKPEVRSMLLELDGVYEPRAERAAEAEAEAREPDLRDTDAEEPSRAAF
jgi:hypothetical protein